LVQPRTYTARMTRTDLQCPGEKERDRQTQRDRKRIR